MNIVETRTFQLGRFTVRQQPRFDSPSWAQYLVFLGDALIGKSFSVPDLGCCEWLYRQRRDETTYAETSAKLLDVSGVRRCRTFPARRRVGRPSNAERAAQAAAPEEVT